MKHTRAEGRRERQRERVKEREGRSKGIPKHLHLWCGDRNGEENPARCEGGRENFPRLSLERRGREKGGGREGELAFSDSITIHNKEELMMVDRTNLGSTTKTKIDD